MLSLLLVAIQLIRLRHTKMQWFESFDILEARCITNSCTKDPFKPSSSISISIELTTRSEDLSSTIYLTSIATLSADHQSVKLSSRYLLAKSSISIKR